MMLPHTRCPTRDGVIVGARLVTWAQIEQHYVCRKCGGKLVHHIARADDLAFDYAECADCRARDYMSARLYEKHLAQWPDIVANLPDELKALVPQPEPLDMDANQAMSELYDL